MGNEMRVGDADREATAAELREHYASGRLTLEELNERLDQALAAKTRADLTACMRDLPPSPRAFSTAGAQQGTGAYSGTGSSGRTGPFGSGNGPFGSGNGPFGRGNGPFGGARGDGGAGRRSGRGYGGTLSTAISVFWAVVILGMLVGFGIAGGQGRPFVIVLGLFALAVLRRLFGRRRRRGFARRSGRW